MDYKNLCVDMLDELAEVLNYSKNLKFKEKLNYKYNLKDISILHR
jgi:hypothetical protein